MNELDRYFLDKLDVYFRMMDAYPQLETQVLKALGEAMSKLVQTKLGEGWKDTFGSSSFYELGLGYIYRPEWALETEAAEECERYPALWFPMCPEDVQLREVLGLSQGKSLQAFLWATPISNSVSDLAWARSEWEALVETKLPKRVWSKHGSRKNNADSDWGSVRELSIDHRAVVDGFRNGDLAGALHSFADCLDDLAAVAEPITELVTRARERQADKGARDAA